MKIGGEIIVPFLLLLGTGLVLSSQPIDPDDADYDAEGDPDAIVFEDQDLDEYLNKQMAQLEKDMQALEEEKKVYLKEVDELKESKTQHEAEKAEFGSVFQRKMKEIADAARTNEEGFQAQSKELDKEENILENLELEYKREKEELEKLESEDQAAGEGLRVQIEQLHLSEAELKNKNDEHQVLLKTQARFAEEEEKRLRALYGDCEKVPESFRVYLKVFDEEYTRLCYKVTENE